MSDSHQPFVLLMTAIDPRPSDQLSKLNFSQRFTRWRLLKLVAIFLKCTLGLDFEL